MDLSTKYPGLTLPHPLMPGVSPLAADLDAVKRLEDAGAAAIVMPSFFVATDSRVSGAHVEHPLQTGDVTPERLSARRRPETV